MLRRLTKMVELLGVNAVPVLGVSLLIAARLDLHRRWNGVAAPSSGGPAVKAPGAFLGTAIPCTLAHGVMLAAVFAAVVKVGPDLANLRQAIVALLVVQGLAFGVDLWTLERWPAHRVNERADFLLGRVVLVT